MYAPHSPSLGHRNVWILLWRPSGGTLLVLLPADVILTYRDAWHGFLQQVGMKEGEVLRFEDSDLTALFDEYAVRARQRHFVRSYVRQLKMGSVRKGPLAL